MSSKALRLLVLVTVFAALSVPAVSVEASCNKCVYILFNGWFCDTFATCGYDGCTQTNGCRTSGDQCGPITCLDEPGFTIDEDEGVEGSSSVNTTTSGLTGPTVVQSPLDSESAQCGQIVY